MIERTIYGFLQKQTNAPRITPTMNLKNDLGMDSMDLVELSLKIESEFNIHADVSDIIMDDNIRTVGDLVAAAKKATEISKKIDSQPKKTIFKLYKEYNYKNYCRLTDKRCRKITAINPDEDSCLMAKCKLAQNFYKIAQEKQK